MLNHLIKLRMIMNPVDYSGIQTPGQSKDRKTFFFFLEETENGRKKPTNNRHLNKPGSTNQLKLLTLNHTRT